TPCLLPLIRAEPALQRVNWKIGKGVLVDIPLLGKCVDASVPEHVWMCLKAQLCIGTSTERIDAVAIPVISSNARGWQLKMHWDSILLPGIIASICGARGAPKTPYKVCDGTMTQLIKACN